MVNISEMQIASYEEKRQHERTSCKFPCNFVVLSMHGSDFHRVETSGMFINSSKAGAEIMTIFPLQPGQVLQWDDRHNQNKLHMAQVKWSQEMSDHYRAGLMFL